VLRLGLNITLFAVAPVLFGARQSLFRLAQDYQRGATRLSEMPALAVTVINTRPTANGRCRTLRFTRCASVHASSDVHPGQSDEKFVLATASNQVVASQIAPESLCQLLQYLASGLVPIVLIGP